MCPQLQLIPGAISEILASTSETGMITLADRYGLMAAILNDSLSEEEIRAINRIIRAVVKGRVTFI
jgi:hypothetical protein